MGRIMDNLRNHIRTAPRWLWLFLAIFLLGVFLRTYHFRDWMIFNPDQARDALLVQDMLAGSEWPLLGPQAGNTFFRLGPVFYYFEFASAWLFGSSADKMAYPDLLFSIGAIGLMFVFLRRFFERSVALAGTFLFVISFFVVTYSRFAFNPNSIPFFTLLFLLSLFAIMDHAPREKLGWATLLGIAMGVGFQLHTILFIAMPFVALLVLGYLFMKKQFVWKSFFVALACFFLTNAAQVVFETRNDGANIQSFFSGARSDATGTGGNLWKDLSGDVLCHIQGQTYIVSSLGGGDKCDFTKLASRVEKRGWVATLPMTSVALFGTMFTIGGFMLFFRSVRKEKDMRRKRGLVLVAVYSLIVFIILFPVSSSVSIRYFIVIEFLPFLLAGLWLNFLTERLQKRFVLPAVGLFVIALTLCNATSYFGAIRSLVRQSAGTDNVAYFGEVEALSRALLENSQGSKRVYLSGRKSYLSRYGKPLEYFGRQGGVSVSKAYKLADIRPEDAFFYVMKKSERKNTLLEVKKGFATEAAFTVGNVTLLKLGRISETEN